MAASDYLALATLKAELGIASSDTTEDTLLASFLTRAARAIDRFCQVDEGAWAAQTLTKVYDWWGHSRPPAPGGGSVLTIDPLLTVTTLKTDDDGDGVYETTWTAGTDYLLYPNNDVAKTSVQINRSTGRYAFPTGQQTIQIVGSWGLATTAPAPIVEAVALLANRYRRRTKTPEGIMGSAETGYVKLGTMDPDVAAILEVGGCIRRAVFA